MIPRKLHYCWFGGGQLDPLIERSMASWRERAADCEIVRWDETNLPDGYPQLPAMLASGDYAQVANLVRLHALLTQGGIYLDTDVEVLKPLDPLLDFRCFVGVETDRPNKRYRMASNAVMGAEPGHPFIEENMRAFQYSYARRIRPYRGVTILNIVLYERFGFDGTEGATLRDGVRVVEKDWLHSHPKRPAESALAIHHCLKSWHRKVGPWREIKSLAKKLRRAARITLAKLGSGDGVEELGWRLPRTWPVRGDARFRES